ncbi:MAG: tyrosine-type recombinase/integrase [Chloroflexi bacterium]|nr:tyrosine-type recombinase/integrase [Chloroflexota bacterium]
MPTLTNDPLSLAISDFLLDRQARNQTPSTLRWYRRCVAMWRDYLLTQNVTQIEDVTPAHVRRFIVHLSERGHTPGGVVTLFTGVKAFLRWYGEEYTPANWNPLAKVKAPKRPQERLDPLSLSHFQAMVDACPRRTFNGDRDRALLMLLLDTGIRHQELTDLALGDVDANSGQVIVRMGKGRKGRAVFIGAKTRRALLAYYRHRESLDNDLALWVKRDGERLTKAGIRQVVRRAALRAGVDEPGMHEFRRAFAVNSLRNGMDVATLQRLLGHSSLEVVNRYLALVEDDLRTASGKYGVVDNLKG